MLAKRPLRAAGVALAAAAALCAAELLPERVAEVSRNVEQVRGRRFQRAVPAAQIDRAEARRLIRGKLTEGLPIPLDQFFRSLAVVGLIEDSPRLTDALLELYDAQVVAFYDPVPRKFFVVEGAEALAGRDAEGSEGMAQDLIFAHELTHALQDETLHLADRMRELKEDSDRALALQCLLEGEATLVMIRVVLLQIPGAGDAIEEQMAPLLAAGALERANIPKDVPDYFVEQLFLPYTDGTRFVRDAVKKGGWAEVDRLWKNPPASTAEILHGSPYPPPAQNLLPSNLVPLAPGKSLAYTDTMGEWTLRFLLGRALPEDEAARGASGWRGDRIAFFGSGASMGYYWRLRFDGPDAAARCETALKKARSIKPAASPETYRRDGSDLVVTSGLPAGDSR